MRRVDVAGPWLVAVGLLATVWGLSVSIVASTPEVTRTSLESRAARSTEQVVARLAWGSGRSEVGRSSDGGRGPLSFAVDDRERVWLLDQENRRLLRIDDGQVALSVPMPDAACEDVAVAGDRVCILSQAVERRVLVFDGDGAAIATIGIPSELPPVLHVLIDGSDVLVECPREEGRTYHVVGSLLDPRSASAAPARGRTAMPLTEGRSVRARIQSPHDVAVDVQDRSGAAAMRLRAASAGAIRAILDVSSDARGALYLTTVAGAHEASEEETAVLTVARFSPDGELTSALRTRYAPATDAVRRVAVSASGEVYRMDTDGSGLRIVRWRPRGPQEGSDR